MSLDCKVAEVDDDESRYAAKGALVAALADGGVATLAPDCNWFGEEFAGGGASVALAVESDPDETIGESGPAKLVGGLPPPVVVELLSVP